MPSLGRRWLSSIPLMTAQVDQYVILFIYWNRERLLCPRRFYNLRVGDISVIQGVATSAIKKHGCIWQVLNESSVRFSIFLYASPVRLAERSDHFITIENSDWRKQRFTLHNMRILTRHLRTKSGTVFSVLVFLVYCSLVTNIWEILRQISPSFR